jgi:hypothetical protein
MAFEWQSEKKVHSRALDDIRCKVRFVCACYLIYTVRLWMRFYGFSDDNHQQVAVQRNGFTHVHIGLTWENCSSHGFH